MIEGFSGGYVMLLVITEKKISGSGLIFLVTWNN